RRDGAEGASAQQRRRDRGGARLSEPEYRPERPGFSVHTRIRSFGYAFSGLRYLIGSEHNAWIHLTATAAVIVLGMAVRLSAGEWLWLVVAIAGVWLAEAFNTAIERLADIVSLDRDPRLKVVKDVAAAGVLVSAIAAAIIGLLIFYPHLRGWF
ncbi:diacylglycerol kinase family protein, partial [Sphingosinicella sp.]|uniref:diacylglycerol kinase family protein n=1 Tax=Sphingosinicella sp. TaxID=1917971 RepID=UPI004037D048